MEGAENACFVCLDPHGPVFRPCRCHVRVHQECMQRVIRDVPSHASACPVCTYRYEMTHVHVRYVFRANRASLLLAAHGVMQIALTFGVCMYMSAFGVPLAYYMPGMVVFCAVVMCAGVAHSSSRGGLTPRIVERMCDVQVAPARLTDDAVIQVV